MPDSDTALVTPEQVAARAGLPLPLDAAARATIEEALEDAYAEAAVHLGRPATPETFTQRGVLADGYGGWLLDNSPVLEIISVQVENGATAPVWGPTAAGTHTVTYRAGLDPAADRRYGRALARFLKWSAAGNPMVRRLAQNVPGARLQASVNVEGQGVVWEATAAADAAGAPATLSSLDEWVKPVVYQAPGIAPHPIETGAAWLS
ncbi:hypothetical protein [Planomonospora sp. ID82291]|uniref:hypothetical protein n=1 Tax=Planomonospora sp. ID82291 TaxID=2738136 RepID=UPI0018C35652|nr:hypothetical protein [Planomonospora sp. ID82291]MBG0818746.1 hypothetical protein [Planomonospora sp. ID82291]